MTEDWTPPAAAVEAAAIRVKCRGCGSDPGQECRGLNRTTFHPQRLVDARAALIAARPVLVSEALAEERANYSALLERTDYLKAQTLRQASEKAEALAEVARLRGAATDIERLTDTYTVEGTEIVLNRMHDLRRERDEAREALAAVAALADEWEEADGNGLDSAVQSIRLEVAVNRLRAVLADHVASEGSDHDGS